MKRIKTISFSLFVLLISMLVNQCTNKNVSEKDKYKILFLHHSIGEVIWRGGSKSVEIKGIHLGAGYDVPEWFSEYNKTKGTAYDITDQIFPNKAPYGWSNYPFDYYNIWVKNSGNKTFLGEPTLEMLTKDYKLIIVKHCYPVSSVTADSLKTSIDSPEKTLQNYKLQYIALKQKMLQFPDTKFLVWTGAASVQAQSSVENASRARSFFEWVKNRWDTDNDNIFLWDFYDLETDGGLFLKPEYASSSNDSHPNKEFAKKVAPYFCQRIVDVIENNGKNTSLIGAYK